MKNETYRGTLLRIPLTEERFGSSLLASVGVHGIALLLALFGGLLLPSRTIQLGSGAGGGTGGDVSTVGVVDDLSGGAGMVKPSLTPKPPALEEKAPEIDNSKAISLPQTIEPKKKPRQKQAVANPRPNDNVIPTAPQPGSGGSGGRSGGSGGGFGGGIGVSIGAGSGGFGDSWYAQAVEGRISSNWIRPPEGVRVEMIYSFYINPNGTIRDVRQEKSSGNLEIDRTAERAIRNSNPLTPPPPEFRGRPIQFRAQFVYPPNP